MHWTSEGKVRTEEADGNPPPISGTRNGMCSNCDSSTSVNMPNRKQDEGSDDVVVH